MLITFFSAKGSPGVSAAALTLTAVWPHDAVLLEADPAGGDIAFRCRADGGGTVTQSPNILGLATAVRGDRTTEITTWTQKLANGVTVVPGVASPAQASGMTTLWRGVAGTAKSPTTDILADVGRTDPSTSDHSLLAAAEIAVPVLSASVESLMHTREVLKGLTEITHARVMPLLIGPARTSAADSRDVDEVLAAAGVIADKTRHLPLDHAGLRTLENGADPQGRVRMSALLRAARPVAEHLASLTRTEVTA